MSHGLEQIENWGLRTLIKLGVAITAFLVTILVAEFLRHRKFPFALHGWLGLLALAGAEFLMFRGVEPAAMYFTPLAWTAYLLIADAAIHSITGQSRLTRAAREFGLMALLSIPLWLIFEAYNLRLENWTYVGLPENWLAKYLGYAWSFATITPGILVTAELIESFGWWAKRSRPIEFSATAQRVMMAAGTVMLLLPLVLPRATAAYLFALVWLGFIFLLDPINARLEVPSLIVDFADGRRGRMYSLLLSGLACGFLWEFWNYWATAKWLYIFPMFQDMKIFEMPVPGFLGFPPFAVECFTMYYFSLWLLRRLR